MSLISFQKKRPKKKSKKETKRVVIKNTTTETKTATSPKDYTVKKGDTLYSIAKKFNTTVTLLKRSISWRPISFLSVKKSS